MDSVGAVTLLVSRVWAVVDTIVYPFEHNRKVRQQNSTTDFYLDPTQNQAGFIFRF
jgi:hypothetical protein